MVTTKRVSNSELFENLKLRNPQSVRGRQISDHPKQTTVMTRTGTETSNPLTARYFRANGIYFADRRAMENP